MTYELFTITPDGEVTWEMLPGEPDASPAGHIVDAWSPIVGTMLLWMGPMS